MITQGKFQKVEHTKVIKTLSPFNVYLFGDVHLGVDGLHSEKHFNEFLRQAEKDKTANFIEMGDPIDVCSGSERAVFSNRALHIQTTRTMEQRTIYPIADEYCEKIGFMKGKLLAKLNGNHYCELTRGRNGEDIPFGYTTDDYIAQQLETTAPPGVACMLTLKVDYHGQRTTVEFFVHHGKGGTTIGPVEKMQQVAPHSQILAMGHNHGLEVKKVSGLIPKAGPQVGHKTTIFARTGSFLKGYVAGMDSYVCDGLFRPSELGVFKLTMTPYNDKRPDGQGFHLKINATI